MSYSPLPGKVIKTRFGKLSEGTVQSDRWCCSGIREEVKELVEFVCQAKDNILKINANPGEKWIIEAYSNSNFAGDKDERKSITGYTILICSVPMAWRFKAQNQFLVKHRGRIYCPV
jgi:hypothetical protein